MGAANVSMYPQVFGKYVLERELARGGMARVVLATLRGAGGFEKKLVVKQIRDELASDDEFVRRFVLEAKTTVTLAHPNIVPVYELGVEQGTYFLAMEFVEGASLAELLRAGTQAASVGATAASQRFGLSPDEAAYVGVEVCRALDYAHRRMNVVHRDVTPRNVMVDEEGHVKVIDFGIAAPVATDAALPSGNGVFGSPGHMPPEQMDAKELTPAADVFAVAVLLMELWSGRAPFRRRTRDELEAAMRAPHPKPSDADRRLLPLDDVIASAMSLDPAARPQHADDLGRALRRFLAGVDLGDLARNLGDRVRDLRTHPPPAPAEPRPFLQRPPSRPTATQVGTKTFAARDEVGLKTATTSVEAAVEVSTRRIESRPPSPSRLVSPSAQPPREGEKGPTGYQARQDGETIAMPPLESTPRAQARASRKSVAFLSVAGAGALAIAAFFVGRAATTPLVTAPPAPPTVEGNPAVGAARPRPPGEPAVVAATPFLPGAPGRSTTAAAPANAQTDRAQLVLLGDGTLVSIDGVQRGPCPVRATLEPGAHAVVFSYPPTGESRGESLTLGAGEHVTLHADFTSATPSIRRPEFGPAR